MIILNNIGFKNVRGKKLKEQEPPAPSYEPETIAYMDAIGVPNDSTPTIYGNTGAQIWNLCNSVVLHFKDNNVFSLLKAFWPMYGDTAATLGYELKNPKTRVQDSNAYYMLFSGNWVFDATGLQGNGSNTYASTNYFHYTGTGEGNGRGISICVASNENESGNANEFGAANSSNERVFVSTRTSSNLARAGMGDPIVTSPVTDARGITSSYVEKTSVNSSNVLTTYLTKNQTLLGQAEISAALSYSDESYYGASKVFGNPDNFSSRKLLSAAAHGNANPSQINIIQQGLDMWEAGLNRKTW